MALDETKKYNVKDFAYIVSELIKGGGGGGTVDSELSLVSENPVQNKVVTSALNGKQATLTAGNNIDITDNIISATGGGGDFPNGKPYEPLIMSSINEPVFKGGVFSVQPQGIVWNKLDVSAMTRETPSSYSASSDDGTNLVANAFDDDVTTRWLSASGVDDAYIEINFASNKKISVLGLQTDSGNRKPRYIEVYNGNTLEKITAIETMRNDECRYSYIATRIVNYYVLDKVIETNKLRIRFFNDWFGANQIGCSVIQLYSGELKYKPNAFFAFNGEFSLLSQTETTAGAELAEEFRPVSYAGHSKYNFTTKAKTYTTADIDTWWNIVSNTPRDQKMTNAGSLAGRALNMTSLNGSHSIIPNPGCSFIINGERLANNQAVTLYKYNVFKWVKPDNSDTGDSILIPDTPLFLNCEQGLKSINARKLDDYYELDATVALVSGGGTLTIGATNKVISSVKVGQNVNISGYLDVSVATSPTGTLTITGLPHTCRSGLKYDSELSISVEGVTIPAGYYWSAYVINNTTTIRVRLLDLTGAVVDASPYITTNAIIRIGGVYNASS